LSAPGLQTRILIESPDAGLILLKLVSGIEQLSIHTIVEPGVGIFMVRHRPLPKYTLNSTHLDAPPQQFVPSLLVLMLTILPTAGKLTECILSIGVGSHPNCALE